MRNLLILFGLLAVAALLAFLGLTATRTQVAPDALSGPSTVVLDETTRPQAASSVGSRSLASASQDLNGLSDLAVEVYDPGGQPLYQALVTPTVPAPTREQMLPIPKLQPARWRALEPGEAQITVTCKNFLPHTETFTLVADEPHSIRVELVPFGRLTGTVSSPTGEPMGAEIWILGSGQRHPETPLEARELESVRCDRYGRFELRFPEKRSFQLSVGNTGKSRITQPGLVTLGPGDDKTLDVVVADHCQVQVAVSGLPQNDSSARGRVTATIERMENGGASGQGGRRRSDPSTALGGGSGERRGKRNIVRGEGAPTAPWWRPVASGPLDANGKASFIVERPGPEHRLVLTQMGARHISGNNFGLRKGRPVTIQASLPFLLDEPIRQKNGRSGPAIGFGAGGKPPKKRPQSNPSGTPAAQPAPTIPPLTISISPMASDTPVRSEGFHWDSKK